MRYKEGERTMIKEIDKFVVKRQLPPDKIYYTQISIRKSTNEILRMMQNDTGAKVADLVDAMVKFCADRLVVEE
jgi:hypothetical protein